LSLTGNLEDLPLLDILQLVSFSRKTGVLSIQGEVGESAVVFRDGFVVSAFSGESLPPDARIRTLSPDKRRELIRGRIGMSLERLIRLREGQFSFSLDNKVPETVGSRDIVDETLEEGINAQELLLDLAKGMDEGRRDSMAALEASFAGPLEDSSPVSAAEAFDEEFSQADEPPPLEPEEAEDVSGPVESRSPGVELPTLLLVDDEQDVRRQLAAHFTAGGYLVVEADGPDAAVKKAGRLGKAGIPFGLVTDLGMPTSGGASFHGGFEVVKRLWKMNLRPPVLLMTDNWGAALQARARQMGIASVVFKPGLSKLEPEQYVADLAAFAKKILSDILPATRGAAPAPAASPAPAPARKASADDYSRELADLQGHLAQLRARGDATEVASLVMKVAQQFFERSLLFAVRNDEIRGLWGFGPSSRDENLNLSAREIVVPLTEPSIFLDVATSRRPFRGSLPDGKWTHHLMDRIGRFKSQEAALAPLTTNREVIAVLFGDNPETGREMRRLETLHVFLNQAGIAMENLSLQRKLHVLQAGMS
jgi:CheY-like chemotaxis protein